MRSIRSLLKCCCLVLAACLGFSGFAAADLRPDIISATKLVTSHGAEQAKFHIEQTYMVSLYSVTSTVTGKLTAESNGYRLSELVNVAVNDSEVAKGKIGVGAGAIA